MQIKYVDLGKQVKKARKHNGLTQEDLAEKVGVGPSHISHIETASGSPSLETIIAIMNILEVSPNELFCHYTYNVRDTLNEQTARLLEDCTVEELRVINQFIEATKTIIRENSKKSENYK